MQKATYPGNFGSLEPLGELAEQVARQAGFDEDTVYLIQLAVDEAASNIIEHAYGGEDRGDLEISFDITEDKLIIELQDQGKAFNPQSVETPKLNLKLEEVAPRGLGVHWIRQIMDEVSYSFRPENVNMLTMVKNRPVV